MTIEEAIKSNEYLELSYRDRLHRLTSEEAKRVCLQIATNYHQQAEWLKELIERRNQPEIIYCKDCKWYKYSSSWNCKKYYYCARESITATVKTENDFCSKAERLTDGQE